MKLIISFWVFLLCISLLAQSEPERIILNLTETPSNSIAVTWRNYVKSSQPRTQILQASVSPVKDLSLSASYNADTDSVLIDSVNIVYTYSVVISDLVPGKKYAYRVGDADSWSEWNHFSTADTEFENTRFTYFGDVQNDILSQGSRVIREAYKTSPNSAFFLFGGDLVTDGLDDSLWGELFESGGWIFRTMPVIAAAGNHEYRGPDNSITKLWRPTFTFPENGVDLLPETCYKIKYNDVLIIILDSKGPLDLQAEWLDKTLAESSAKWKVICFHYPVYSIARGRDNTELREIMLPVIDKHEVDLVLNGHDHAFGRTFPLRNNELVHTGERGTIYLTSVAGTKQYELNSTFKKLHEVMMDNLQAFHIIEFSGDSMEILSYGADGELIDSIKADK